MYFRQLQTIMTTHSTYRWTSWFAWLMAAVALLPISVGAVVTTVKAGMAFADWPNSDGHNMLLYPWFQSTGDQFLEHGHRLAGMLIGLLSLTFTVWSLVVDRRPAVGRWSLLVLAGVIVQGLLGGLRVRLDQHEMAFLHSLFAACVFLAICLTVLACGSAGMQLTDATRPAGGLLLASGIAVGSVFVQYVLGGRLRHFGSSDAWLVHPWFAVAVALSVIAVHLLAARQDLPRIQTSAQIAFWLVLVQAVLGLFTWGLKYGYPQWDVMALPGSSSQIALSSLHKVVGLASFAAIGVGFVQILTAARQSLVRQLSAAGDPLPLSASPSGGRP